MKKTSYVLQGEHDEIFVYTDKLREQPNGDYLDVTTEDAARLEALGFHRAADIDEATWRYYT